MEEYYRDKDNEVYSIIRSSLREEVPRKSVANQKILTVTWDLKCKRRSYWTTRYLKISCFVRRDDQKIMPHEHLNTYSTVIQCTKLWEMFILICILGMKSKIIDIINYVAHENIPKGEQIFIEVPSNFKIHGEKYDVVIVLDKIILANPKSHSSG